MNEIYNATPNGSLLKYAKDGNIVDVREAIINGADINTQDTDGNTALHLAIKGKHISLLIELLKKERINIEIRNNKGLTPLFCAVQDDLPEIVKALLSANANMNLRSISQSNCTPLIYASAHCSEEVVEILLKHSLLNATDIINATGDSGTALHLAAYYGREKVIKLLLTYGVDQTIVDRDRRNPQQLAEIVNKEEINAKRIYERASNAYERLKPYEFKKFLKLFNKQFVNYKLEKIKNNPNGLESFPALKATEDKQILSNYPSVQKWKEIASQVPELTTFIREAFKSSVIEAHDKGIVVDQVKLDIQIINKIFTASIEHAQLIKVSPHIATLLKGHHSQSEKILSNLTGINNNNFIKQIQVFNEKLEGTISFLKTLPSMKSLPERAEIFSEINTVMSGFSNIQLQEVQSIATSLFKNITNIPVTFKELNGEIFNLHEKLVNIQNNTILSKLDVFNVKSKLQTLLVQREDQIVKHNSSLNNIGQGIEFLGALINIGGKPELGNTIVAIGQAGVSIASTIIGFSSIAAASGPLAPYVLIGGAVFTLFKSLGLFGNNGPNKEQQMLQQISQQICQLGQHLDKRFDRIELMLGTIHKEMHQRFDIIDNHLNIIENTINKFYHDTMQEFKAVGNGLKDINVACTIINSKLDMINRNLQQGFQNLYQQGYLNSKNTFLTDRQNNPYPNNKIKNPEKYYNKFYVWITTGSNNPQVAGDINSNYTIKEICQEINNSGLEKNINLLANYARRNGITIPTTQLANPSIFSEGVQTFMHFIDVTPELSIDHMAHQQNIDSIIAIGNEINSFIVKIKTNGDFFHHLCDEYKKSVLNAIGIFNFHPLNAPINQDIRNSLTDVEEKRQLLYIYLSLTFSKEILEDSNLNSYLNTKIWDKSDFGYYMNFIHTNKSKEFTTLAINENAIKAIDDLEDLLLEKVLLAQKNKKANYELIDKVIEGLEAFKNIYFSEQHFQVPQIIPEEKASEEFKNTVRSFIGPKQISKRFAFKVERKGESELCIQLTNKDEIDLDDEKKLTENLRKLKNNLENNLILYELEDGEHYNIKLNYTVGVLTINSNTKTLNRIGALLKDAGQNYWDKNVIENSRVFFFKPQKQQPVINSTSTQQTIVEEIECRMQ